MAGEMVQRLKSFAAKADDPVSIPRTYTVEGENFCKLSSGLVMNSMDAQSFPQVNKHEYKVNYLVEACGDENQILWFHFVL